ncbi:hypothetical protein EBB79_01410 [Parasedimentitalea marina]|uniref:Knr4/Smi1-like domain-containing protein n=1 Tax=Parasedimentitalea marina TaxID=2483033 RepID=A0A3T0MY36_9RHOB|nr:SMI1/KNR4 family protein [Parasedimentitalea marina]AZV76686.1 hypothetical protein EBB79_01410 [Parasedimentitalea marina]
MNTLMRFHKAWSHPNYPPEQVTEASLAQLEEEVGVAFPLSYRRQILEVGLPNPTTKLWDWIDDNVSLADVLLGVNRPHLQQFLSPDGIREALGWRDAGMPTHLLPFLYDSLGNNICFDMVQLSEQSIPDASIYYWDHDFRETEKISNSFDTFLEYYIP